jgi:uncharacterized protein (DUF2252 family)
MTVEERIAAGRDLRAKVPRSAHSDWKAPPERRDPVGVLQDWTRAGDPERSAAVYERMLASPLGFERGGVAVMAADLAATPTNGIRVQACGDCHLLNFGGFGTPERYLVYDMIDYDETLRAPWEWDLKRLAAGFVTAGRHLKLPKEATARAAEMVVRSYRESMLEYAQLPALELWNKKFSGKDLIEKAPAALKNTTAFIVPKMVQGRRDAPQFVDDPPWRARIKARRELEEVREVFDSYRTNLREEQRILVGRYRLTDVTREAGGRRSCLLLLTGREDEIVLLRMKEVGASVLEAHAGPSAYSNHGERVAAGQRLMQAASDEFLGWTRDRSGRDFYFRQFREIKMPPAIEGMGASGLAGYGTLTGMILARAHARSGDAAGIAGYLGRKDVFDKAVARFALEYADQTERDHAALKAAAADGRIGAAKPPAPVRRRRGR